MSKNLILSSFLLFSTSLFGASHMLVIGGGGEPNKSTTIFDYELKNASNFVQRSNWQTKITFNGGHSETEKIAQQFASKSSGRNTSFTPESYEALISEYERKMQSGQIKSGDQILLMISSHGSERVGNQKTHYISTTDNHKQGVSNYRTLDGSSTVSLDRLERLTQLAESKGIKLGILDFSCHSGVTQKLANKNTCVISSTGPEHYSWGGTNSTFAAKFTESMRSGRSLEDVFLEAVKNKRDTGYPMISSPIGQEIQETMYPLISPYLHDTRSDLTRNKMKDYYNERYAKDRCENLNSDFDNLINFTYDIENIASTANYKKLRNLLTEYNGLQQGIVQNVKLMNARQDLNKKENYCNTMSSTSLRYCMSFSPLEILNMEFDQMISLLNRQLSSARSTERDSINARLTIYNNLKQKKTQLLRDQGLKTAKDFWDKSTHLRNTQSLANDIATESQKAYVNTYQTIRKEEGSTGPCADIRL